MNEIPTPRTDAETLTASDEMDFCVVPADFAQTLERELVTLQSDPGPVAAMRAEWLHRHNAPSDWVILTTGEVAAIAAQRDALAAKLATAREAIPLKHLRGCTLNNATGDEGDYCSCGLAGRRAALEATKS